MSRPDKDKDRGVYIGPPHSYHKSQVQITGLERQKIQHKRASCVKTGLECQNLIRFSRALVGGASGPRVSGCMRVCARAPVYVVCMGMRVLAWVRAHESVSALMRECACICVWAYADMCMYKMHKHIKAARVVSKKQHADRRGSPVDFIYIYPFLSSPLPLPPSLSWYHHISV